MTSSAFATVLVSAEQDARALDALCLARRLAGPGARMVVVSEHSAGEVSRAARAHGAGLVVVGSERQAARLLRLSPVPVAVAPEGYAEGPDDPIRVIGVGFDGEDGSRAALRMAERIALEQAATLRVYAAVPGADWSAGGLDPTPGRYRATIRESLGERLVREVRELDGAARAAATTVRGDPVRVLADAAAQGVDLLVVGSHGRGRMGRALLGSVSCELMARVECPVVALPWAALPRSEKAAA
jgi:nucleotide-binding universal stress UspA family protein